MLNPLEMQHYIHAIAARANVTVQWENKTEPRTDGKVIYLPRIQGNMTEQAYSELRHYVVHEVDHIRFTDFKPLRDQPTCQKGMQGAILNLCEDIRIEAIGAKEYLGDLMNSGRVQSNRLQEIADAAVDKVRDPTHPDHKKALDIVPMLAFTAEALADTYPAVAGTISQFENAANSHPLSKERLKLLHEGDYHDALKNTTSTHEVVELAERMFREVWKGTEPPPPPPEEKPKPDKGKEKKDEGEQGEGEEGGKDDELDKKDGGDGPSEAIGDGEESAKPRSPPDSGDNEADGDSLHSEPSNSPEGEAAEEYKVVDYSDMMLDAHNNEPAHEGMSIRYTDDEFATRYDRGYTPATKEDYKVVRPDITGYNGHYEQDMKAQMRRTNPNFASRVRTILQVRAKSMMMYGKKSGQIHQGSLHRLVVDDKHYAERIFKKRVVSNVLDAAVYLLVDQSGSMSGDKFVYAACAAAMMSNVVGNVLHIPTMISSFTDQGRSPTGNGNISHVYVHRAWQDKLLNEDKLLASFSKGAGEWMQGNADGDSIMWAFNQLAQQRAKRKLLIVFSDGQPAGGNRGDNPWYTAKVVKEIEQETPVDIVGIGIRDATVRMIYKEHYVIQKLDDLEHALLSCIEGKLK